jgi:hypothetical protein
MKRQGGNQYLKAMTHSWLHGETYILTPAQYASCGIILPVTDMMTTFFCSCPIIEERDRSRIGEDEQMFIAQQQFSLFGAGTAPVSSSDGNAPVNGDTSPEADQEATAELEEQLTEKKSLLDSYRKDEQKCEQDSGKMLKRLNSMAREDTRLKKIEPRLRYSAIPTPMIMGIGAALHNPIVAATGGLVMLASIAMKVYCQKRIPKIDREFWPLKSKYEQSFDQLKEYQTTRHKLEVEVSSLESRIRQAREQVIEVKDMAGRLNSGKVSGASEILDMDDYLVIGGMKIEKRSEKEEAVFGLAQNRAKFARSAQ